MILFIIRQTIGKTVALVSIRHEKHVTRFANSSLERKSHISLSHCNIRKQDLTIVDVCVADVNFESKFISSLYVF